VSDVKPALTPEEWANFKDSGFPLTLSCDPPHFVDIGDDVRTIRVSDSLHAVAAFCLHRQPFGFTREMLAAVEFTLRDYSRTLSHMPISSPARPFWDEHVTQFGLLVANLKALLPPEGA
jgi:hypothetical protein